ncbi:hypothetical protein Krac_8086 [Ktedonobacter racemifer DSM 44963]|uniref:Uncharacterized protein n=1 Tax=Ktedonobacter racemifer DSM 44963 TaxID=485913 RepID=D6TLX3_KTERA|nr:hypothetical protein Krac_8086 [Ktedonobacter racemifer DSM 44963]
MVFPVAASLGFALICFIKSKLPKNQQAKSRGHCEHVIAAVKQARPALVGSEKKAEAMHVASYNRNSDIHFDILAVEIIYIRFITNGQK